LGENLTPFPKPRSEGRLVRSGIYSRVRHPLYTSVFLAALGWALLWQSWPALLVALSLAPFFEAKARREETWLREQFAEYDDYTRHTHRFLPWIY
jgi:protein-S-isoprenylcysteine O-methyltransferase Ste14